MGKRIRWGILGTGAVAAAFAEGLRALPDAELTAVGSRAQDTADAFAQRHRAARAHRSYEQLVHDPGVDVIYVATPSALHAAHARMAIEHGKAVVCEKPFATSEAEAEAVIEAARRRQIFCMEAMWMRFVPAVRELCDLVRKGEIGDVRMVAAELGIPFSFDPSHRLFSPALGGGALLDLGVYPISLALMLLGNPTAVTAQAVLGETGVDEQVAALLAFDGGRQAVIHASLRNRAANAATVMGTRGMLRLHEPLYRPEALSIVRAEPAGGRPRRSRLGALGEIALVRRARALYHKTRERTITRLAIGNGYAHEAVEAMRCLRAGERESPIMPLDETLAVLRVVDQIRASFYRAPAHANGKDDTRCASLSSAADTSPTST